MRISALLPVGLLLGCACPAEAGGGVVYGTVVRAGAGSTGMRQPVSGLTVLMACPTFARPMSEARPVITDSRGGFTLFSESPNASGCQIRATSGNRAGAPVDIFISGSSLKYEFEVDADLNLSQR